MSDVSIEYGGGLIEPGFEFSYRRTPGGKHATGLSPEDIYRNTLFDLFQALTNAYHYGEGNDNFPVAASAPIMTDTHENPYRIISSSNWKPYKGSTTRVCGERPMLSLRSKAGDISMRLLTLAAKKDIKEVIGTDKPTESLHCCALCRPIVTKAFGSNALLATFRNEDLFEFTDDGKNPLAIMDSGIEELPKPAEVFYLGSMILYHEFEAEYPTLKEGVDSVESIIETLGDHKEFRKLDVDRHLRYRRAPKSLVTPED